VSAIIKDNEESYPKGDATMKGDNEESKSMSAVKEKSAEER